MSGNQSINTQAPQTTFSIGAFGKVQSFAGQNGLMSGNVSLGAERGGTRVEVFGGSGQVTSFGGKIGHEWNWGDFGLDLSARGQYTTQKAINGTVEIGSTEIGTYNEDSAYTTNTTIKVPGIKRDFTYKPKSFSTDLTLKGTYKPLENIKLGFGARVGYKTPTSYDISVNRCAITVETPDTIAEFPPVNEHMHLGDPTGKSPLSVSPVITAEANLGNNNLNISVATDEITLGYSRDLVTKTKEQTPQNTELNNEYILE